MRQGDDLFFAPGVRFDEVDLVGPGLSEQYRARIEGFYLAPARLCIEQCYAFAAGLLLVSTIDFMAGLHHPAAGLADRSVGADFREFARNNLQSFDTDELPKRLYDEFRNGLAHEARIKNGGEFCFDWPQTVRLHGGRLCINPDWLLREVEAALDRQIDELRQNETKHKKAAERLRTLFAKEFGIVQEARKAV
jgi:hypothetical protein